MHPANEEMVILERRKSVQDLWLRGRMQWEIARDLTISKSTVKRDLKIIVEQGREWVKERQGCDLWEEIAKLNRWEQEANDAWERSKRDAEIRTAKLVKLPDERGADGAVISGEVRTESSKREEGQCGDVRYLTEARHCAEQRCRLLGYFVNKTAFTTPNGGDTLPTLEVMVVAVLAARAKLHAVPTGAATATGPATANEPACAVGTGVTAPV